MNVNPGELDKRISFAVEISVEDKDGFKTGPKDDVKYSCWASTKNTSGKKLIEAGAEFSEVKKRFLIRYTAKVNKDMYILYRGDKFRILYMNPYNDDKEYIEIWTEKKELPHG